MNAPRFSAGARCVVFQTGIPVTVTPLPERHPRTGQRLYSAVSRSGRVSRIQERNLQPTSH